LPPLCAAIAGVVATGRGGAAAGGGPEGVSEPKPELRAAQLDRVIHAARRRAPIRIDGSMDEAAWGAAEVGDRFVQLEPDEGRPASVDTRFRMLWDDEALYFGAECDDRGPPTANLSRRDRAVEGDWVAIDLDTTYDRRTAYHFQVFAAGQQRDGLHFNDTEFSSDWDAAWESAVARTPTGWSVEIRIPLRILRIPDGATRFGFNVYRRLSARQEEDQWRFRPRGTPGDVSLLGFLEGIDGIHPRSGLELRPYVSMQGIRTSPVLRRGTSPMELELAPCSSQGLDGAVVAVACAGIDLRQTLTSDLSLVASVNPEFSQVEADARVLNLTTFEAFLPEKRSFFLEGLDLFKSPLRSDFQDSYGGDAYQVFYSRRIGRTLDGYSLIDGQTLVYQPTSQPVLGAIKLVGTIGGAGVGILTALEPRVEAQLLDAVGRAFGRRVAEARLSAALRISAPLGSNGLVGFVGTAVDPLSPTPSLGLDGRHAHVGGADLTVFDSARDWSITAQTMGSLINREAPGVLRDGTVVGGDRSGFAGSTKLAREGGVVQGQLQLDYLSPRFDTNDLGFMQRSNLFRGFGRLVVRDLHANGWRQSARILVSTREGRDGRRALRARSARRPSRPSPLSQRRCRGRGLVHFSVLRHGGRLCGVALHRRSRVGRWDTHRATEGRLRLRPAEE
jgi:hypothetical protein